MACAFIVFESFDVCFYDQSGAFLISNHCVHHVLISVYDDLCEKPVQRYYFIVKYSFVRFSFFLLLFFIDAFSFFEWNGWKKTQYGSIEWIDASKQPNNIFSKWKVT